jgi:hypothetical protein
MLTKIPHTKVWSLSLSLPACTFFFFLIIVGNLLIYFGEEANSFDDVSYRGRYDHSKL